MAHLIGLAVLVVVAVPVSLVSRAILKRLDRR